MYTIWLFTRTDLKTIVIPSTVFGAVCAISGPVLTTNSFPLTLNVAKRVPLTAFWAWINLLPFAIDNQRRQESIKEDAKNKPWRPLPSKRLSPKQAKRGMLVFYLAALLSSLYIGCAPQCITLIGLGYWYNDLKGADNSCITRNFINSCGYICYTSGAMRVASGHSVHSWRPVAYQWLLTIGLVIFTTIQSQDMYDQAGDSLRARWTVPLVVGDLAARWSIVVPVAVWSWFCPVFWQIGVGGSAASTILGFAIVWRTLSKRTVKDDKISFRIYNMWIMSLFILPFVSHNSRFWRAEYHHVYNIWFLIIIFRIEINFNNHYRS